MNRVGDLQKLMCIIQYGIHCIIISLTIDDMDVARTNSFCGKGVFDWRYAMNGAKFIFGHCTSVVAIKCFEAFPAYKCNFPRMGTRR